MERGNSLYVSRPRPFHRESCVADIVSYVSSVAVHRSLSCPRGVGQVSWQTVCRVAVTTCALIHPLSRPCLFVSRIRN